MVELLERVGWTQGYFAGQVGVDIKTVNRWCNGKENTVAMAYLRQIARILGV